MRTEAEQMEINQKRIEAELYQLRVLAGVQTQQTYFANFMVSRMKVINKIFNVEKNNMKDVY